MPTFDTKRVEFSSLTRFEESRSSEFLGLYPISQCRLTQAIPSGYPSSRNTYGLPTMLQVLCYTEENSILPLWG